jgi:hypothetical protein
VSQPDPSRDLQSEVDAARQVVAVLRIRVTEGGELLYGETIDAATERHRRFSSWIGLVADMRSLIAEALHRGAPPDSGGIGPAAHDRLDS